MTGVFCYRNLNRKGVVWSVRSNRSGLVIRRSGKVVLKDVTFKVSQAGRKRVLKEKRKNVHAGAKGTLANPLLFDHLLVTSNGTAWKRVRYNPYEAGHFVDEQGRKVIGAAYVALLEDGAWVCGARYA